MKTAVLFGGTGYIGSSLASRLIRKKLFERVVLADIRAPTGLLPSGVHFHHCDVRNAIHLPDHDTPDWIFNFAAVHREPGHNSVEYFDTNLAGARNVCEFAAKAGCRRMLFTSSISVYGPTRGATNENAPTQPVSPYGISKLCAEFIHEAWAQADKARRLIICRPGVIYGPEDPGNILRMVRAVQRGYFFFPGPTTLRKSYGYIEGLLDSFEFAMGRAESLLRFNYVESETETIGDLVRIIRNQLHCTAPVISVPVWLLQPVAAGVQLVTRGKSAIHPARVRKAATPTYIVPQKLKELGFRFSFDFDSSLQDWRSRAPQDFR